MRNWLVTDSHLFHVSMVKKEWRPADYQERLRRHWLSKVAPEDHVHHMGDVIMGPVERLLDFLNGLPGTKFLAAKGNHDHRSLATYCKMGFTAAYDATVLPSPVGDVYITHKPAYCLLRDTVLNVHGHLHDDLHRVEDYDGVYPQPWHRLLALEYTDYSPVLLDEFVLTPGNFAYGNLGG